MGYGTEMRKKKKKANQGCVNSVLMAEKFLPFLKWVLLKVLLKARWRRPCLETQWARIWNPTFFLHRDSEIMQQKQKAANERKSLQAGAKWAAWRECTNEEKGLEDHSQKCPAIKWLKSHLVELLSQHWFRVFSG